MSVPNSTGVNTKTVRIISLPKELQTDADVLRFMKDRLDLDCLQVKIVNMRSESGVCFRSAFVDIDNCFSQKESMKSIGNKMGHAIQGGCVPGGIHFDNGKPMGHIKIVDAKSRPSENPNALLLAKIEDLTTEIAKLKSYAVVPVPGMPFTIDVGEILAENHRLKEEIERLKR
jgi:hypothetical protein